MTRETDILQAVRLRASQLGLTLFRNNSGMLYNKDGTPVKYGLAKGSSDLVGWRSISTVANGVIAQFIALECKQPGKKPTPEQAAFINAVNKAGGIGAVITDPAQLEEILK